MSHPTPNLGPAFAGAEAFFWSDSYRGHTIAALSRGNGWLVYLDHVLQHNKLFATVESASVWLRCQVDAGNSPSVS